MKNVGSQICGDCEERKPIKQFGVCRARKNGRNLYCKTCIKKKVAACRKRKKEFMLMQKQRHALEMQNNPSIVEQRKPNKVAKIKKRKPTPIELILNYVDEHDRPVSHRELRRVSGCDSDTFGLLLVRLLVYGRELKAQMFNGERFYFRPKGASGFANNGTTNDFQRPFSQSNSGRTQNANAASG